MSVNKFAQQIQDVRWRMANLQKRAEESLLQQQAMLAQAFEEFQTTLEELQLVEEDLRQQNERSRLLNVMCDRIRQSLNLEEILSTTVTEVRQFLACDRVLIYQFQPDWSGTVIVESVGPDWKPMLATSIRNPWFEETYVPLYQQGHICATENIYTAGLDEFSINLLAQFQVKANLVVPILQGKVGHLWGLLIAHQCAAPRKWQQFEIDLLSSLATQVAIAIQQAQLYQQLSAINTDLERQVQERTVELQQKIQELEQLNILKDDFLSTVSHELRTPMANMKMAIQMLKTAPLPERQQRYLEILQAECNRETELINDLLDLQRLQAQSYPIFLTETINLQDWLPRIVESFRERAVECKHSLELNISPDVPPIISNRAGLERILAELLNNACKYTPASGEVIFRVRRHCDREPPVTTFTISNQAEIPAAALSRIFEKFYRVPNADPWKQGGTGLGLALVQKLVEQLGGTIQVESGSGWTTFTVQLPA